MIFIVQSLFNLRVVMNIPVITQHGFPCFGTVHVISLTWKFVNINNLFTKLLITPKALCDYNSFSWGKKNALSLLFFLSRIC